MLTYLLTHRPARPVALIAQALATLQERRDEGVSANITDLLASASGAAAAAPAVPAIVTATGK